MKDQRMSDFVMMEYTYDDYLEDMDTIDHEQTMKQINKLPVKEEVVMNEYTLTTLDKTLNTNTSLWIVDSGATCHMTNDMSGFTQIRNFNLTTKYANDKGQSKVSIIGTW
jgi:hypothetical protein